MTKNAKIIIGSVVLTAGTVYFISKNKKSKSTTLDTTGNNTGNNGNGQVIPVDQTDVTPSLNFSKMADAIFDAMDGYGTNSNNINAVLFSLNTDADFDTLYNAYGVRTVSSGAGNIFVDDFTGNMVQCIKDDCDSSEIRDFNKILAQKGLTRRI